MRVWSSATGIVLALVAASLAAAQTTPRPRITVVINSPAASPAATTASARPDQPTLRTPLGAAAMGRTGLSPSPMSLALPAPALTKGVTPMKGLNPLSASGLAAQCRAQCAEARYICTAHDSGDCDTVWGQCVVRCSGANYTETPDLASPAGARPGP
jgi:hypothetical protein